MYGYRDAVKRKQYLREYQRAWVAARRDAWFQEHGPCVDCGTWEDLEADHIDPSTKLLNPSSLWSMSPTNPRRVIELAKCVVRCTRCHLIRSNEQKAVDHGGGAEGRKTALAKRVNNAVENTIEYGWPHTEPE